MNIIPTQNVWFDDAATSAMGEAFDRACKTLQLFGSAVPAIVANFIIAAAKNGERDPGRLYQQVLADYGIEDTSMPFADVLDPPVPAYAAVTHPARSKARFSPEPGFSTSPHRWRPLSL